MDVNLIYAATALRDIDVQVERKNHAFHSSEFVMGCQALVNDKELYLQTIKEILKRNSDMALKKTQ